MNKPTEEEIRELFVLSPLSAVRCLQRALTEMEAERDEARTVALNLRDLFVSCCVCGAELLLPMPPHCEDGCDLEGDGECVPGEEWKCQVQNLRKTIESWKP